MGVQEIALILSTAVSLPLAALYSVARWDTARYALMPNRQSASEQSQSDDKNQKIRGVVLLIAGPVFLLFCGLLGLYSRSLPPAVGDLAFIILLSAVPFPLMVTLGIGSMFLPSLLMGSIPTDRSPPLRSVIKVEVIKGAIVVLVSIFLPKLITLVVSWADEKEAEPPRIPSAFAPWKDRTEAMYTLFLPAMQVGIHLGTLLSRLYRIDMANYRRNNPSAELRRDTMPGYLLETEPKVAPKMATEDDAEEGTKMERSTAIRVMCIPEAIRTNTIRQLLCPPWYFAAGFATLLLLLLFAMPTLVYHSPVVKFIKEDLLKNFVLAIDDSAWLSPNVSLAMYGALHMVLLSLPILLSVAVVSFLRGESDFVWNYSAEWKPFCMDETPEASDNNRADEKIVAAMLINGRQEEERLMSNFT
ncbi:hypothetical protein QFC21_000971 [Naganishia friedmannii]|uniref:Uncharacterized protein n=1 Tax=Naganishia friedmannii TaxID=89922 RepID=A0ACC2W6Y3_9TREE|nr:hypothetical protein QFC21_000971 [Naganishia friedmannii]